MQNWHKMQSVCLSLVKDDFPKLSRVHGDNIKKYYSCRFESVMSSFGISSWHILALPQVLMCIDTTDYTTIICIMSSYIYLVLLAEENFLPDRKSP